MSTMDQENVVSWRLALRPPVVAAVVSPLLLLADLALIAVFILQQNWKAVILMSVVFFCGAQAIYWYFRTKSILTNHQQALVNAARAVDVEEASDDPPTYEEVIKTEAPPPPYYMVVSEIYKPSTSAGDNGTESIPNPKTRSPGGSHKVSGRYASPRDSPYSYVSPFIQQITSGERSSPLPRSVVQVAGAGISGPTIWVHQDPVETIRAPILREVAPASIHLPPTAREGVRRSANQPR
nr:uncharacterized protein LOC123756736 [Procambarus clarkii]